MIKLTEHPVEIQTATDSVVLRHVTFEDAHDLFELIDRNRRHLSQFGDRTSFLYPTLASIVLNIKDPEDRQKEKFGIWDDNTLVGIVSLKHCGLSATLGYYLGEEFTGNGYATNAVKAIVPYAATREVDEVIARVHPDNTPSRRVLSRAGFTVRGESSTNGDLIYKIETGHVTPGRMPL